MYKPFVVLENGKPCCYRKFKVDKSWNRFQFKNEGAAFLYALNWLGAYAPIVEKLEVGKPYYYAMNSYVVVLDKRIKGALNDLV
jgi:hypothetical protein